MLEEKAGPIHSAAYRPHDEYDALVLERLRQVGEQEGGLSGPHVERVSNSGSS